MEVRPFPPLGLSESTHISSKRAKQINDSFVGLWNENKYLKQRARDLEEALVAAGLLAIGDTDGASRACQKIKTQDGK